MHMPQPQRIRARIAWRALQVVTKMKSYLATSARIAQRQRLVRLILHLVKDVNLVNMALLEIANLAQLVEMGSIVQVATNCRPACVRNVRLADLRTQGIIMQDNAMSVTMVNGPER